ncbi:MAG: hypothetical protein Q8P41_00150 [Pseudomonadota bacterium]|nr:hypothetical protein [Pseudomonadota bacterium]
MTIRMTRRALLHGAGAGLVVSALAGATGLPPSPARTNLLAPDERPRGFSLGLFASDPAWDYGPMLAEIAARGATDVLLVVAWYQEDERASRIAPEPRRSPEEDTLRRTFRQARDVGLRTALMPIVRLRDEGPGRWRGSIAPAAGIGAWFASYGRFVLAMAGVAEEGRAARFIVGSEFVSLEHAEGPWRALVAATRARFGGRVSYSANWDHAEALPFVDALDELGINAYFPLADDDEAPTRAALRAAWRAPRAVLAGLRRHYGKPLVVTEVGYPARRGAARAPWQIDLAAPIDTALQAELLDAACEALCDPAVTDGLFVWNWFGYGGPSDGGYSPRGKPAAARVARWLARMGGEEQAA